MPWVPFATARPVPSHGGQMSAHYGLVLHVQVGSNSCYAEFSNPANEASSTWWIAKDGRLEQYVDSDEVAWAEAAGNPTWDSVETEGEPEEPLTDAQVQTLGRLFAWGVQTYGWPLQLTDDVDGRGLGWHGMGGAPWGGHTGCPGDLRKAQRQAALDIAASLLHPAVTPSSPEEDDMLSYVIYPPVPGSADTSDEVVVVVPPGRSGVVWLGCDFQPQTVRCFSGKDGAMVPYGSDPNGLVGVPPGRKIGIPFTDKDEMVSLIHGGPNIPNGQPHPVTALVVLS